MTEDEFQPRIEDPPTLRRGSRYVQLKDFVRAAEGKWCVVLEKTGVGKRERGQLRSRMWGGIVRQTGYEQTGFEIRASWQGNVFKIYARFIAANVVKHPQRAEESQ